MTSFQSTVRAAKYFMPAEWSTHSRTWMIFPYRSDIWRSLHDGKVPAQTAFIEVAAAISRFEQVLLGVDEGTRHAAEKLLQNLEPCLTENIRLVNIESNDAWIRDSGPTFLLDKDLSSLGGISWQFNSWGLTGLVEGINYTPYEKDNLVADAVLTLAEVPEHGHHSAAFIMEGGSFHTDGEGTIIATEECLLNPNRNPHMSKEDIEAGLLFHLGAEKMIWLPRGLTGDEDTNGHIDNFCCFCSPGHVLLAWCDEPSDPQYEISREAFDILKTATDARGRELQITKLQIPPPMYYTEEECSSLQKWGHSYPRTPGQRLAASYINFYICNGGIICPSFGFESDSIAAETLAGVFPGRTVVQVPGREILLGGGNIHCITQQQPATLAPFATNP